MASVPSDSLVVFRIGEQEFAIGVAMVERVVRAVEVAPLPEAPRGVRGVINVQGHILPVFDLRLRFGEAARDVSADDYMLIVRTHARVVALLVDAVAGVVAASVSRITPAAQILPDVTAISGVMQLESGLVLVHDLERFLSSEDDAALQLALDSRT